MKNWKRSLRLWDYMSAYGLGASLRKAIYKFNPAYQQWFLSQQADNELLLKQSETRFSYAPLISILMPVYNTPPALLQAALDSVVLQSYANWELCIANGGCGREAQEILEDYEAADPRIKVITLTENRGISGNTNACLELAEGEYTALFDHDDLLEPDALFEIVKALQEKRHDVLYTDEDKYRTSFGRFFEPNFKPDFSPEYLRSCNYITHFFVVKTALVRTLGGFRSAYDGSQDYDLILRCVSAAESVFHIRRILYHWCIHSGSTADDPESKRYCFEAGAAAIHDSDQNNGIDNEVTIYPGLYTVYQSHIRPRTLRSLSVLIACRSHDNEQLAGCIASVRTALEQQQIIPHFIIIGDEAAESRYRQLSEHKSDLSFLKEANSVYESFNLAVQMADTDDVLFLSDELRPDAEADFASALSLLSVPGVSVLGAKLLNGDTIVSSAKTIDAKGTEYDIFRGLNRGEHGYQYRAVIPNNVRSVSLYGMCTRRETFLSMGGFDPSAGPSPEFHYCLRVWDQRQRVVFVPELLFQTPAMPGSLFRPSRDTVFVDNDPFWNPRIFFHSGYYR